MSSPTSTGQFLSAVAPLLEEDSRGEVLEALRRDWPPDRLVGFLVSSDKRLVKLAVTCLGLTGDKAQVRYVAAMLRSDSDELAAAAEESLWRIWMRAGSPEGNRALAAAVAEIRQDRYADAAALLQMLTLAEPAFAEAHHQLGLVHMLCDEPDEALPAYRQALRLNPYHFAAAQGLGQLYLAREDLLRALEYYELAARIHPRLPDVGELVAGLRQLLGEASNH